MTPLNARDCLNTCIFLPNVQGRRVAEGTAERLAPPQEDGSQSSRGFFGSFMRGSRFVTPIYCMIYCVSGGRGERMSTENTVAV